VTHAMEGAINRTDGRARVRVRVVTGIVLACIAATYVLSIVRLHPTNLFGLTEDDGIYFSSAKALAEGRGYVLPNLPGSPPATKYPILYPWVLSFVWRLNPAFPANLPLAIGISTAFGVGFLLVAYSLLASLGGFSKAEALILTAYLGLHPLLMFFGALVLSEMPFAFFALSSMILADRVMHPDHKLSGSVACGVSAGIAVLTRILGLPILLGILVAGIVRRSWRQVATFSVSVAPFAVLAAWNAIFSRKPLSPVSGSAGQSLGWIHAWTFYTDYAGMWKLSVPNSHVFWAMLKNNAGNILRLPADLVLGPVFVRDTMSGRALICIMAVAALAGILRQAKRFGWKPIHYSLAFYLPVVVLWNYPDVPRFFLPFSPLVIAGAWTEGRRVLGEVKAAISVPGRPLGKLLGFALGTVIAALVCGSMINLFGGLRTAVVKMSAERGFLLRDKRECYDWVRKSTDPSARLVAYEHATVYLYTGRQTIRPMIFSTDEFYAPERLQDVNLHFLDVAEAIGARYWLFTSADLDGEWRGAREIEETQLRNLEAGLPLAFRAGGGTVTVRSLDCVNSVANSCAIGCGACNGAATKSLSADQTVQAGPAGPHLSLRMSSHQINAVR
jgi:hypothetical protein